MSSKHIPGFYFDESKRKYFKIQPNHSSPQGSKYSKDSIAKETEEQISRKRRKVFDDRFFQERTRRSKISRHPFHGIIGLERERGFCNDGKKDAIEAWAQGLEERQLIGWGGDSLFEYDATTKTFILAMVKADPGSLEWENDIT